MKKRRTKEWGKRKKGTKSPVRATCENGHDLWQSKRRKAVRCPICRGRKDETLPIIHPEEIMQSVGNNDIAPSGIIGA